MLRDRPADAHPHRDLYERESFCAMYTLLPRTSAPGADFNIQETIDYEKIRDQYLGFAERIRPMRS